MLFEFLGLGIHESICDVKIADDGHTVMVTELPDNPGTSITNAAENLANEICKRYGISHKDLVWIEHYPPCDKWDETFDLVKFEYSPSAGFHSPRWIRISKERAYELMRWC